MVARALTPEQVNELAEAVRQLQLENQVLKARLDSSRGAGGRMDKLCEFSGTEDDFADWSFKVKCHLSLLGEGSAEALEWAEGRMGEITLGAAYEDGSESGQHGGTEQDAFPRRGNKGQG